LTGRKAKEVNRRNTERMSQINLELQGLGDDAGADMKAQDTFREEETGKGSFDFSHEKDGDTLKQDTTEDFSEFDESEKTIQSLPTGLRDMDPEKREKFEKMFEEGSKINYWLWLTIFIIWLVNLVVLLLKGSKKTKSVIGVVSGSAVYWALTFGAMLILLLIGLYFGYGLYTDTEERDAEYLEYLIARTHGLHKPKMWTMTEFFWISPAIFFAGIVSGTVGIGGGMILGPLMLLVEIPATVVASVNTVSILFSSSFLAAFYIAEGAIDPSYALFYSGCCFVGAYVGKWKTKKYFENNDFILVYVLAGVILSSFALVLVKAVQETMKIANEGLDPFVMPE